MPDPSSQSQRATRKRAVRVGLRTLQRKPRIVGENPEGEPIAELDSIRLVLPHRSRYFHRLVTCSRCSGETVGEAVLSPDHVKREHESRAICSNCALSMAGVGAAHGTDHARERPAGAVTAEAVELTLETPPVRLQRPEAAAERPLRSTEPTPAEAPVPRAPAADVFVEDAVSRVEAGLDRWLEHQREVLAADLGALVNGRLEAALERHAADLARVWSENQEEVVAQLSARTEGRLEPHLARLAELEDRLMSRVDQTVQRLEAALAGYVEREGRAVSSDIRTALARFEEGQRQSLTHLAATLTDRLEERGGEDHQKAVSLLAAELARQVQAGFQQLQAVLAYRLEEHGEVRTSEPRATEVARAADRQVLAAALQDTFTRPFGEGQGDVAARLEQVLAARALTAEVRTVLATELAQAQEELASQLWNAVNGRLEQHREALASQIATVVGGQVGGAREQLLSQLDKTASAARQDQRRELSRLSAQWVAARDQLLEALERVANGVAESGSTAARSAAGMPDEPWGTTDAALEGQLSDLRDDVVITRQSVAELRRAVARLGQRLSASDASAIETTDDLEAVLPGLGMASGFEGELAPTATSRELSSTEARRGPRASKATAQKRTGTAAKTARAKDAPAGKTRNVGTARAAAKAATAKKAVGADKAVTAKKGVPARKAPGGKSATREHS